MHSLLPKDRGTLQLSASIRCVMILDVITCTRLVICKIIGLCQCPVQHHVSHTFFTGCWSALHAMVHEVCPHVCLQLCIVEASNVDTIVHAAVDGTHCLV